MRCWGTRAGVWIAGALAVALVFCGCGGGANSAVPNPPPPQPGVSLSPGAVDFGNIPIGTSAPAQNITLQNTGAAALAINSISTTGDYSVANDCGAGLAPGASCTLNITFTPTATGARPGTAQISDNASNSPQSATLTGTGVGMHTVALSWTRSISQVIGYFVYRGVHSGGPYTVVNSTPSAATNFQDHVLGGQTWYYVVTAVDANLVESLGSNEVPAVVPP